MAITYPLALPSHTGVAQIELRAINAVAYSRSPFTFAGQVHEYAGKMWQADVTLPPMARADAEAWVAFLLSLKGQRGTFYLGDPTASTPLGKARDNDTVFLIGETSSGNTITFDSVPSADRGDGYLKAGDYIQLGNDNSRQLFKVLSDVTVDTGTGIGTADVWPNVRTTIADNTQLFFQNTTGVFRLASNETSWSVNQASIYGITFGAMEAV